MSDFTFVLAIAALALFLIVVFVSFVFPKKKSFAMKRKSAEPAKQNAEFFGGSFDGLPEERFPLLEARLNALNNKVLLAHERLQKVEELLQNQSGQKRKFLLSAPKEELVVLNKRVERLMDFKSNAEIELAAIKGALREKGILKPLAKSAGEKEPQGKAMEAEKELSDAEKKLHDLIYRAASSK